MEIPPLIPYTRLITDSDSEVAGVWHHTPTGVHAAGHCLGPDLCTVAAYFNTPTPVLEQGVTAMI